MGIQQPDSVFPGLSTDSGCGVGGVAAVSWPVDPCCNGVTLNVNVQFAASTSAPLVFPLIFKDI